MPGKMYPKVKEKEKDRKEKKLQSTSIPLLRLCVSFKNNRIEPTQEKKLKSFAHKQERCI